MRTDGIDVKRVSFKFNGMILMAVLSAVLLFAGSALATINFPVGDKTVKFSGYIEQSAQFGISGDHLDTYDGFQQGIAKLLLELRCDVTNNLFFYASGKVNVDWAYDILSGDSEWKHKGFNESRDALYILDEWNDLLHEAHLTWASGNFRFRFGKQIIQWGEMDNVAVTSQIMPADLRRGYAESDFELLFMPITLIKADYFLDYENEIIMNIGVEFIYNPDWEFRGTEGLVESSTHTMGIWVPNLGFDPNFPEPIAFHDPEDGQEFGVRVYADVWESTIQLMYWDGIQNNPVLTGVDEFLLFEYDIFAPNQAGYNDERFIGGSFSREIPVSVAFLGGVAPLIRLEAAYFFDSTIGIFDIPDFYMTLEKDKLLWGVGLDWRIKIPFINAKNGIMVGPEFVQEKVLDTNAFEVAGVDGSEVANYWNLYLETWYLHTKLLVNLYMQYESEGETSFIQPGITYNQTSNLKYTIGANFFHGENSRLFNNKDAVYVKVKYQF
ncbi:MAG: hypothetical protein JRH15_14710 [Deltaproteobacteria bacterium]|nr:hypothetical protein [Deltaproteobacteria bacterium]